MSADAMAEVWGQCGDLTAAQIVVLLAVSDVVNDAHENEFWMRSANLAAKIGGRDPGNVRKRLSELVDLGWIEVLVVGNGGPTRYRWLGCPQESRVERTRPVRRANAGARREDAPPSSSLRTQENSIERAPHRLVPNQDDDEENERAVRERFAEIDRIKAEVGGRA